MALFPCDELCQLLPIDTSSMQWSVCVEEQHPKNIAERIRRFVKQQIDQSHPDYKPNTFKTIKQQHEEQVS